MATRFSLVRISILSLIIIPIVLILLAMGLLYLPFVQQRISSCIADEVGKSLGVQVEIESVRLSFPLNLKLSGVQMLRSETDTLASLGDLELSLSPLPLLENRASVGYLRAESVYLDLKDSLDLSRTRVRLEALEVQGLLLDWGKERVEVGMLHTRGGDVFYFSQGTQEREKESDPLHWIINTEYLQFDDTKVRVEMPEDSLFIGSLIENLSLHSGQIALEKTRIEVGSLLLSGGGVTYSVENKESLHPFLDYKHIDVRDIVLKGEDIVSEGMLLDFKLLRGEASERSGFRIDKLIGHYKQTNDKLLLDKVSLVTDRSNLFVDAELPWAIFSLDTLANFSLRGDAHVSLEDIRLLSGGEVASNDRYNDINGKLTKLNLSTPIDLDLDLEGTFALLDINTFAVLWDGVCDLSLSGEVAYPLDVRKREGKIRLEGGLQSRANSILALVSPSLLKEYNLPDGLTFAGNLSYGRGKQYLEAKIKDGNGFLDFEGEFASLLSKYKGKLHASSMDLSRYMPRSGWGNVTTELDIEGCGFDPFKMTTISNARLRVRDLNYAGRSLDSISLDMKYENGVLSLNSNSFNPGLNFSLLAEALVRKEGIGCGLTLLVDDIDGEALGIENLDLKGSFVLQGEFSGDLKDTHNMKLSIQNTNLRYGEYYFAPDTISLESSSNKSACLLALRSGDLHFSAQSPYAFRNLRSQAEKLQKEGSKLMDQILSPRGVTMSMDYLIALVPEIHIKFESGANNPLQTYMRENRLAVQDIRVRLDKDEVDQLSGFAQLGGIRRDTLRIDSIEVDISTLKHKRELTNKTRDKAHPSDSYLSKDSLSLFVSAHLLKRKFRQQDPINIFAKLETSFQQGQLSVDWRGRDDLQLLKTEIEGLWSGERYQLSFPKSGLILAGHNLAMNTDNFIWLDKVSHFLGANVSLSEGGKQLISLDANQIESSTQQARILLKGVSLLDYRELGLPAVEGILYGDLNYLRAGDLQVQPMITGDLSIQKLKYEEMSFGHLATSLFYEPRNDSSHYITMEMSYEGKPSLALDAIYHPNKSASPLEGELRLSDFPLDIANPFTSRYGLMFAGVTDGSFRVDGELFQPSLTGGLKGREASIKLFEYATDLRLDTIPINVNRNIVSFDRYPLYSGVDEAHPIYLDGTYALANADGGQTNLRVRTDEILLINEARPRNLEQLLYGKLYASADLRLRNRGSALSVRGDVKILGGTNCTYIMKESLSDASDQLDDVVRFVDFSDTIFIAPPTQEPSLGGMDINLKIDVDPSVRFGVDLTSDGKDYVRVEGGGELQFVYPPFGEMSLVGNYEMRGGGTMRYTLPLVGAKNFTIDKTSYLRFSGSVYNPYLNLLASQTIGATVKNGETSQRTNFQVSIVIKDNVEHLNLGFELAAPDNLSVQNELSSMSAEERGKQALGLLASGVYLGGSGNLGGKLSFDNALSSLLQSQINSATNSLLRGTDLSLGMERIDGIDGGDYTNYTYNFSRRFYNDRIRITIGGKLQSGNVPTNQDQTLIDNVSLEYQLDKSGVHSARIYHKRITNDPLDGIHTETGIGYIIRRRLARLGDLFKLNRGRKLKSIQKDSLRSEGAIFSLPNSNLSDTIIQPN